MEFFSNVIKIMSKYWKTFLVTGVSYTLLLSVITVFFGAIIGIFLALARSSKIAPFRWISIAIVEVIRGTPMLLQMYVAVFLVPKLFASEIPTFLSVSIALVLNSAAYVSEVFRSGIQAVDRGQTEAARSLGLTSSQTFMKVILPQAIKNILPALGNEFIMIIKDTSLASTFFIGEVMTACIIVKGNTYLTFECMFIVAVIYFVMTFVLSKTFGKVERRLKAGD